MYDGTTKLCLKLVRAPSTSSDANINCLTQADDGRLVQLDTREKHEFAKSYLRSQGQGTDTYIGGIRDDSGKYTWLDGTEIKDANWCPGQPESRGCVSLWEGRGFCLDDVHCSGRMASLCEVPMDE
ncbi:snaclec stejaggregin-A subunit alpha-like [Haliotis rubra]|uniref:snaclec stejaggregin-A subunit alpha-like n=1 Tax=Haliotis rubra TaxID=36100 RepID=UPI001EE54D56|nr:snaclec stejaggregin-A subunit alpha-like [Haliotis rubra]